MTARPVNDPETVAKAFAFETETKTPRSRARVDRAPAEPRQCPGRAAGVQEGRGVGNTGTQRPKTADTEPQGIASTEQYCVEAWRLEHGGGQ